MPRRGLTALELAEVSLRATAREYGEDVNSLAGWKALEAAALDYAEERHRTRDAAAAARAKLAGAVRERLPKIIDLLPAHHDQDDDD